MQSRRLAPSSWLVAAGRGTHESGMPLNVPPILGSTFELGGRRAYSRDDGTPTWEAFEELMGGLEGGDAIAFASGMAAAAAFFDLLPTGALIALPDYCYQGVAGLAEAGVAQGRWRVQRLPVDATAQWIEIAHECDLLWLESPSNPLLIVADLPTILAAPRRDSAMAVVDSTFATPLGQLPLALGADAVVHSATKYLGGHSDLLLGVAVARSSALAAQLRTRRELGGATPGALETYLATRGMRTLALRFARQTRTAGWLARRLQQCADLTAVRYPGLPSHPTYEVARSFMKGFGGVISFDVVGGAERADAICRSVHVIRHATSLGGVESTVERRAAIRGQEHVPAGLLRLSVGCEEPTDLWRDLSQAFDATRI